MSSSTGTGRKNQRFRWVAISKSDNKTILAEGIEPLSVCRKADKTGVGYIMAWMPAKGANYIFRFA